jgi:hypothetical protein
LLFDCFSRLCFYSLVFLCESRDHVVMQPTRKDTNSWKPSKSGLIGVWYKDNLYLGTNTIGNRNPHPTNIDSRTRSKRMTPRKELFFDKSFFSFLQNHGREIISSTYTHTHIHTKCSKQELLLISIGYPYVFGYVFIYTDSRLKETLD